MAGPNSNANQATRGGNAAGGRGQGGGRGPSRGRGRGPRRDRGEKVAKRFTETVVRIARNAKVVKGGRRFSFSAFVVVGDGKGFVGIGHGKANEVPIAVEKGVKEATKAVFPVPLVSGGTLPHQVIGRFGSSKVFMWPAAPGTGVIAGAAVKAVLVACGVKNVLTKTHGSTNPTNVLKATENALKQIRTREQIAALRGVDPGPYHWPKEPATVSKEATDETAGAEKKAVAATSAVAG